MRSHSRVTLLSKRLTYAYAKHIDSRVKARSLPYLTLGVGSNTRLYTSLFRTVLVRLFNLKGFEVASFSDFVVQDCISVLKPILEEKVFRPLTESTILMNCVFSLCTHVLEVVSREIE